MWHTNPVPYRTSGSGQLTDPTVWSPTNPSLVPNTDYVLTVQASDSVHVHTEQFPFRTLRGEPPGISDVEVRFELPDQILFSMDLFNQEATDVRLTVNGGIVYEGPPGHISGSIQHDEPLRENDTVDLRLSVSDADRTTELVHTATVPRLQEARIVDIETSVGQTDATLRVHHNLAVTQLHVMGESVVSQGNQTVVVVNDLQPDEVYDVTVTATDLRYDHLLEASSFPYRTRSASAATRLVGCPTGGR